MSAIPVEVVDEPAPVDLELPTLGAPMPWRTEGACRNPKLSPADFFLEGVFRKGSKEYIAARDRAKAVCALCTVREECLKFAMAGDIRSGIWGGLTSSERRRLRYPKRRLQPDGSIYEYPQAVPA